MSKITVEIDTPNRKGTAKKNKRSTRRSTSKVAKQSSCPPTKRKTKKTTAPKKRSTVSVAKKKSVVKKSAAKKTVAKKTTPKPTGASKPKKHSPKASPKPKTSTRRSVPSTRSSGGFFRGLRRLFVPRSSSLFRIKQPPYTNTPVERLDDGPTVSRGMSRTDTSASTGHTATLSDKAERAGDKGAAPHLVSARIVRVKGEGYRLAIGSPVFYREGSIYIFGHITAAHYDGTSGYRYDVTVGRGTIKGVSEDDITPIEDTRSMGLSDGKSKVSAPDPESAKVVRLMNQKFRKLQSAIDQAEGQGIIFVAYCGGKHGYMVRRFVASQCPVEGGNSKRDTFEGFKPIGMGPKGLDAYFQKRYGLSWTGFLEQPTDSVRKKILAVVDRKASDAHAARTKAEAKKAKAAAKREKKAPKRTATTPAQPATRSPRATVKRAPAVANKRPLTPKASAVTPRAPKPSVKMATPKASAPATPRTAAAPKAAASNLDAAEEGMKRLEALLSKAIA